MRPNTFDEGMRHAMALLIAKAEWYRDTRCTWSIDCSDPGETWIAAIRASADLINEERAKGLPR